MPMRKQAVTPFHGGQNTNDHQGSEPGVAVHFKMSFEPRNGQPDPLQQALTSPPREFKDTQHFLKRPVETTGHKQSPHWAPLSKRSGNESRATSIKPHTSRPGENADGSNKNRKGGNALAHSMAKVGTKRK